MIKRINKCVTQNILLIFAFKEKKSIRSLKVPLKISNTDLKDKKRSCSAFSFIRMEFYKHLKVFQQRKSKRDKLSKDGIFLFINIYVKKNDRYRILILIFKISEKVNHYISEIDNFFQDGIKKT